MLWGLSQMARASINDLSTERYSLFSTILLLKRKKKKKKPHSRPLPLSLRIWEDWTGTNFQLLYLYFKIYIYVIKSFESVMMKALGNSDPELRTLTLVSCIV